MAGTLFPGSAASPEVGKEYRLEYAGKMKREEVLAQTPAAPWQLVRSFCSERPHTDKRWHNLLVWGDNLLALRELLADQQGPNRFGTRGKIRVIYNDPPFATKQDFMKDREKAYRDKVLGAQFIEFLRRRLILLREVMADMRSRIPTSRPRQARRTLQTRISIPTISSACAPSMTSSW